LVLQVNNNSYSLIQNLQLFYYIYYKAYDVTRWISLSAGEYHYLLYSYNFHSIKNTHLRHMTVHYFSVLYNRKPHFFRIGRPDKSVFFSYCTLCKGSNSLIFYHLFTGACINGGTFNDNSYRIKVYRFLAFRLDKDTVTYFFLFVHNSMNFSICKPCLRGSTILKTWNSTCHIYNNNTKIIKMPTL
jgi:hypothetical protein